MKIKRYNKKNSYSFCFGALPVLDLLEKKPEKVLKILFKETGLNDENVEKVMGVVKKNKIPFEINDRMIEKIASKENTFVVCVFEKYECELQKDSNHVVLVNPTNPGNLGTILRSMVGFGFKDIALIKPAVDIFQPSIVRSAMGSMFFVNFKYFESFEKYREEFSKQKVFSFMIDGEKGMGEVVFEEPFCLVFGNESNGLGKKFKSYGESLYIPQSGDVDSLNLSISVGIGLYVSSRGVGNLWFGLRYSGISRIYGIITVWGRKVSTEVFSSSIASRDASLLKRSTQKISVKNNLNAFADGVKNVVASVTGGLQLNYAYA